MQATVDCEKILGTASIWQRCVGGAIDFALCVPLATVFAWVLSKSTAAAVVLFVPMSALALAYPIYFHGRYGQTVGKLMVGTRLVRPDGEQIRRGRAWARSAPELVFAAAIGIGVISALRGGLEVLRGVAIVYAVWTAIDLAVMLTNRSRRAAHDLLAGTCVVSDQVQPRRAPKASALSRGRDAWRALRRADA
jgi:uncharacterized RDD family membrane protein YckC